VRVIVQVLCTSVGSQQSILICGVGFLSVAEVGIV